MNLTIQITEEHLYFFVISILFLLVAGSVFSFNYGWAGGLDKNSDSSLMGHTPDELIPPGFVMTNGVIHTEIQSPDIHSNASKSCARKNAHICTNHEYIVAGLGISGAGGTNVDDCLYGCNLNAPEDQICATLSKTELTAAQKTSLLAAICTRDHTFWDGSQAWNIQLDSCTTGRFSNSIGRLVEAGVHCLFKEPDRTINNRNGYVLCGIVGLNADGTSDCNARNTEARKYYCCR